MSKHHYEIHRYVHHYNPYKLPSKVVSKVFIIDHISKAQNIVNSNDYTDLIKEIKQDKSLCLVRPHIWDIHQEEEALELQQ